MTFGHTPSRRPEWSLGKYWIVRLVYYCFGWPNYLRRMQWPHFERLLNLQPGITVLDVGAGQMQYTAQLSKQSGIDAVALDSEFTDIDEQFAEASGFRAVKSPGEAMPLHDCSVDRIVLSSVLHMVPVPEDLLRECRRVLSDDGFMVLSVPNTYRFIRTVFYSAGITSRVLRRLAGLPEKFVQLEDLLNHRFGVGGARGYYNFDELAAMLDSAGFEVVEHVYGPAGFGTFVWEAAVVNYIRIGNLAFHALFLVYPLARIIDSWQKRRVGCEHIVKVQKHDK